MSYSVVMDDVLVKIGALSLITPEPEEQIISVLSNVTFDLYNRETKLHDIALIEVIIDFHLIKYRWRELLNKVLYIVESVVSFHDRLCSARQPPPSATMKSMNLPNHGMEWSLDGEPLM